MAQRFVVAMMMHETNTFSPLPTPIESFGRAGALSGADAIAEAEGTNTPLGGFIDIARGAGAEFVVPMAGECRTSGDSAARIQASPVLSIPRKRFVL